MVRHPLQKSSSERCRHLPLILWLFSSSSNHSLPSPTAFPSRRIHPKFNYFLEEGFGERKWAALSTLSGARSCAPRNASPTHIRTQAILAVDNWGFTLLNSSPGGYWDDLYVQLHVLSHTFWGEGGILNDCTYLMCLGVCSDLCRMLPPSDTDGNWRLEATTDIHFRASQCFSGFWWIRGVKLGNVYVASMKDWLKH